MSLRRLGRTDIEISGIGLGCRQFSEGFGIVGGFWPALPSDLVQGIVDRSLAGGINWFDTAEAYGNGRSERALAQALQQAGKRPGDVVVATKWMPVGRFASSAQESIAKRVSALAPYPIDLHQVHQPWGLSTAEQEMRVFAELVKDGKIRSVGVSNFGEERMRRAHATLQEMGGLPLASNQVKYSLLDRKIERNGVLAAAKALGITIIAYSPLEQGLLSGKFHDDPSLVAKIHGPRKWTPAFWARGLARSRPLITELQQIAKAHGATPSQVALAWVLQFHGDTVVAIPGATKVKHAEENVGAMRLTLSSNELAKIDELSRQFM